MNNVLELFQKITTFIFDVDGVLTDGTLLLMDNGIQARTMNVRDGFALQLAVKKGYRILIVSGSTSDQVIHRLKKLNISDIRMSVLDKKSLVEDYLEKNSLSSGEVLYMGDDIPDLPAMSVVKLSCCPADAANEIRDAATYVSSVKSGYGCVRDVIEKVLKLNDHWEYHPDIASR
ncbi:MAG: HAD hydrolase family protein [Chitinophagaceae bacterium]|jgi:3-deoxy-D-manno-octulosonate 8-phosphate phosphatase (KDO 8-P phosphatase)|nr:HAD hydrolase family protein [Chitinophagaceae bacterium]OQY95356.1 MAG: 3-deoxy-D-manno-octulosonate 8-phosphate phosphatase [Sphingobacteriales bacterium UTBCD1]